MGIVVAAVVVGMLLIAVGVLGRRMRERSDPVFGTPVPNTAGSGTSGPSPAAGHDTDTDVPPLDRLTEGLRAAVADGDLTDDEIQRLLPGAEVTRQDGGLIVTSTSSTSHRIQGPDGQVYERLDDVPDPEVRERLRRLLG